MPGFTGHTITNSVALVGVSTYMLIDRWSIPDILAVDAGILISTIVLSPDMDLFTSRSIEEWGVLRFLWWPYAKFVKHRDRLHTPLLGTFVRWLYLLGVCSIVLALIALLLRQIDIKISLAFTGDTDDVFWNLGYLLDIFIGANIADALHFSLDMVTHGLKHGHGRGRYRPASRYGEVPPSQMPYDRQQ